MINDKKNELNGKKDVMKEIEESKLEKVAGGMPILHPVRRYEDPDDERDDG